MVDTALMFVSGKGGTGKSAVAAAIAIAHARKGASVLAIDMGSGLGLGAHLRHPNLTYAPTEVRPGIHAMSIDRSRALDEYLKLQLRVPQGAPTKQIAAALAVLADTAPGVREIISIGKPVYETWKGEWDLVITDAPSLGQFQSYLRAPKTITELVPTGNVRRQATALEETLTDGSTTSVVLVSNPAELPTIETNEAVKTITGEHLATPPKVIINRYLEPSGLRNDHLSRLPAGSARDAATLQLGLEAEQTKWIDSDSHDLMLPYLRGVLTPGEVAGHLADAIGTSL